ncbi:MAG: YfcE family phosphodiesterase [Clostridia bacterium]|nr:YfcE family phosphodiesterase [Clostridia bacterium]
MKFLVISDTHGRSDLVDRLLALHSDRDGVLFLGDGVRDLDIERLTLAGRLFGGVRGNCDGFYIRTQSYDFPEELLLNIGEYTVIMMHGHTHGVKSGVEDAAAYASQRGADILIYGHTHIPTERYYPQGECVGGYILKRPLWVMNPGSLGAGRDGRHSFGLLQIKNGQVLISHGEV